MNLAKQLRMAYAQWQYHRQLQSINERHQTLWQEFIAVVRAKYASGTSTKSAVLQATHEHHLAVSNEIVQGIGEFKVTGKGNKNRRVTVSSG